MTTESWIPAFAGMTSHESKTSQVENESRRKMHQEQPNFAHAVSRSPGGGGGAGGAGGAAGRATRGVGGAGGTGAVGGVGGVGPTGGRGGGGMNMPL